MKRLFLIPLLIQQVFSKGGFREDVTGALLVGNCTFPTSTSFVLTATEAVAAPQTTTFHHLAHGCDDSHPNCCLYEVESGTTSVTNVAQCPQDFDTFSNPYNTAQSSLCCPIGWDIFPTPLPGQELYACYNATPVADTTDPSAAAEPLYATSDPKLVGDSKDSFEETIYVILTPSYRLEPYHGAPAKEIIGVSVAGAALLGLLLFSWFLSRYKKTFRKRRGGVVFLKGHEMRGWGMDGHRLNSNYDKAPKGFDVKEREVSGSGSDNPLRG